MNLRTFLAASLAAAFVSMASPVAAVRADDETPDKSFLVPVPKATPPKPKPETDRSSVKSAVESTGGNVYWAAREWSREEYETVSRLIAGGEMPQSTQELVTTIAGRYGKSVSPKLTRYLLLGGEYDLGWAKVQLGVAEYHHWETEFVVTPRSFPTPMDRVRPTPKPVKKYLPNSYQAYLRVKLLPPDVEVFDAEHAQGRCLGYLAGDGVKDFKSLAGWEDKIACVGIPKAGVRVRLYEHADRGGRELVLDRPGLYNLADHNFHGIVSSLVVEKK